LIRTGSNRLIAATNAAYAADTWRNCPGHVFALCGHESHTAACGSHSAGMRKPNFAGDCFLTTDITDAHGSNRIIGLHPRRSV
jgi:hypothetical protein